SVLFKDVPDFQLVLAQKRHAETGKLGRGVPDVAANASTEVGYLVGLGDGRTVPVGGTSAVVPMIAGLIALANEKLSRTNGQPNSVGFVTAYLYGLTSKFNNIRSGDNNITGTLAGYQSGIGWDPCTGVGSPRAAGIISALT